jgi:hypothetical protein
MALDDLDNLFGLEWLGDVRVAPDVASRGDHFLLFTSAVRNTMGVPLSEASDLICSATSPPSLEIARRLGATRTLTKPFEREDFISVVRELLGEP